MDGRRQRDDSMTERYFTRPSQHMLGAATVTLSITEDKETWNVTALFARRPPTVPIEGAEMRMLVLDVTGTEMPMLHCPQGLLVEAGGSMSRTVNADFGFAGARPPGKVVLQWAGQSAVFHVLS
jgi:hypothetical protein